MRKQKGLSSRQMSSLYKKLKKKMPPSKAYQTVGQAKRLSKRLYNKPAKQTKKKYPYYDFDGDGVINKYDCKPYNKYKQDRKSKIEEMAKRGTEYEKEIAKEKLRKYQKETNYPITKYKGKQEKQLKNKEKTTAKWKKKWQEIKKTRTARAIFKKRKQKPIMLNKYIATQTRE